MKLANASVLMDKLGSTADVERITPAEAQLLCSMHFNTAGKIPVVNVKEIGDVQRTPQQEVARLCNTYGTKAVRTLFPGANPVLPESFKAALGENVVPLPESKLLEADVTSGAAVITGGTPLPQQVGARIS